MRQESMFLLRWRDVDIEERRIHIRKDKTGPRTIVMSLPVQLRLALLRHKLIADGLGSKTQNNNLIFPPSDHKNRWGRSAATRQNSFATAFERRVDKLGLNKGRDKRDRLTFRSLRRIARVRFEYEVGLDPDQSKFMIGHSLKKDIDRTHYDSKEEMRRVIQEKLDRHYLKGKTAAEMDDEIEKERKAS